MGNLSRLGDGESADKDFLNDIVDGVNGLSDIVWADQGALIWNGQTDSFNNIAKFRIVSGEGRIVFDGKKNYQQVNFTYNGLKFTQAPHVFIQPIAADFVVSTITSVNTDSCWVGFQSNTREKYTKKGMAVKFTWLAFGPTA
jgi:hypothetical protein